MDDARSDETSYRLNSRNWDEEYSSTRRELMVELKKKLQEYDELILRERRILQISAPSRKNHRRYFNYVWNEKPLCEEEYEFVYQEDDMLYLTDDAETAWMDSATDLIIAVLPVKVLQVRLGSSWSGVTDEAGAVPLLEQGRSPEG